MINKKVKRNLLLSSSVILPGVILPMVVSCSETDTEGAVIGNNAQEGITSGSSTNNSTNNGNNVTSGSDVNTTPGNGGGATSGSDVNTTPGNGGGATSGSDVNTAPGNGGGATSGSDVNTTPGNGGSLNNNGVDAQPGSDQNQDNLYDNIFKSIDNALANNPVELKDNWNKQKANTASDFRNLIISNGNNAAAVDSVFNLWTNYSNLKDSILGLLNISELGLTSINISFGNIASLSQTGNSINYQLIISFSANNLQRQTKTYNKILIGFKTFLETFNSRVSEFEQWINQLNVSNASSVSKTSKDVFDDWFDAVNTLSNPILSSQKIYSTLSTAPINQEEFNTLQNQGVFRDLNVQIKKPLNTTQEAAKKCVSWNEDETDKSKKGTVLTVTFVLSTVVQSDNGKTKNYKKEVVVKFGFKNANEQITTYLSFQGLFDKQVANFMANKNQIGVINPSENSTTSVLNQYYQVASSSSRAISVDLKDFLNNNFSNWNFEQLNNTNIYGITIDFNAISLSTISNRLINISYTINWASEQLSQTVNFDIEQPYLADDSYFSKYAVSPLESVEIQPSNTGRDFSSNEVYDFYNKFKSDNNSLDSTSLNYQDKLRTALSQYISNLLPSDQTIMYEIQSITWNNKTNVKLDLGKELYIDFSIKYYKLNDALQRTQVKEQAITKTVKGFISGPEKLLRQFNAKGDQMKNALAVSSSGRTVVTDEVNANNWTKYISNTPANDFNSNTGLGYKISSLDFNTTPSGSFKGAPNGEMKLSFVWTWTTQFAGVTLDPFTYSVSDKIIPGFKTYYAKANDNMGSIVNDWRQSNYLSSRLKSGVKLNTWFTSYFGYDIKGQTDINDAFALLWDLPFGTTQVSSLSNASKPGMFGIETNIINVKYSNTDSSLTDTQLKFTIQVKNLYPDPDGNTLGTTQTQEFKVDGFMDPFDSTARQWAAKGEFADFNDGSLSKYNSVPSQYRMGDANSQTSWASWWLKEPYKFYEDQNQSAWLNAVSGATKGIISNISDQNSSYSSGNIIWHFTGVNRRGYKDNDGVCRASIASNMIISTNRRDQHNNSASTKYKNLTTNYLTIYLYYSNKYWK